MTACATLPRSDTSKQNERQTSGCQGCCAVSFRGADGLTVANKGKGEMIWIIAEIAKHSSAILDRIEMLSRSSRSKLNDHLCPAVGTSTVT